MSGVAASSFNDYGACRRKYRGICGIMTDSTFFFVYLC